MSYTDKQYTNPGWNNQAPPPLSASNLNDIANALQALNISSTNRSTLGISATQDMQDGLILLKNLITSTRSSLQSTINSNKNIASSSYSSIKTGSFVGNGQEQLYVPKTSNGNRDIHTTKFAIYTGHPGSLIGDTFVIITNNVAICFSDGNTPNNFECSVGGDYEFTIIFNASSDAQKWNGSGTTYNYVLFG